MRKVIIIFIGILTISYSIKQLLYITKIYTKTSPISYTQESIHKDVTYKKYSNFFTNYTKFSIIPGLKQGGVPQGLCYSNKYNVLLISEYHKGGPPSVIHILDIESKKLIKSVILNTKDGNPLNAHVGGITTNEEILWITDSYTIYEFSLKEIIESNNMSNIKYLKKIDISIKADFISYHNDTLWIGEYYYYPIYQLDKTKNKNRINNKPLLVGFNKNYESKHAIYIPDKIQAIEWTNNNSLIVSTSFWSFESSNIKIYNNPLELKAKDTITINNKTINAIHIDNITPIKEYTLPPMAEGISLIDTELYILFESSSNLYKHYTKYKVDNIYKTTLSNEY